ncbi:hypothetical protein LTR66_004492 [Elasticomyces elasticus]|nr:hypothetical protein LTR66_004492 [Elasticomyces elasticus]
MSLDSVQEASYSAIIDAILEKSDLSTISAKRIRKALQAQVDYDITPQKHAIKRLINDRFDKFHNSKVDEFVAPIPAPAADAAPVAEPEQSSPLSSIRTSPAKRRKVDDESEKSDVAESLPARKKKRVQNEEDDAAYAARLQAEENSRARPTRGGTTKKRPIIKKSMAARAKRKSATNIRADDDSDVALGSCEEKKERKGGFHKPMALSDPLSALLQETSLSRPQTVKKIWEYVKARELQDPNDKRQIRCDDAMRAVFKQDRVHMFTMNKILNHNLYAMDE